MSRGAGVPLKDRRGPGDPAPGSATQAQRPAPAVGPPPGTPCWVTLADHDDVPGVILGWQQADSGTWHALVSAWIPHGSVSPRR